MSEENESKILEDMQNVKKEYTLEKHVQTILLGLILSSIVWIFQKVNDSNERIIRMEARDAARQEQFVQFREAMDDAMNRMQRDVGDLKDRMTRFEAQNSRK